MKKEEIYQDLLIQYDNLSLAEKNAILVYKSKLYLLLNPMTKIPNFLDMPEEEILNRIGKEEAIRVFNGFKGIVMLPKNLATRYTVFSSIDFTDIYTCLHSLKKTSLLLDQARGKITLPDKLTVYRGISSEEEELDDIALGKYLSTALDIEDISPFLFQKKNSYIYQIEVEKGTNVLVTPYSLVSCYDKDQSSLEGLLKNVPMTSLRIVKGNEDCQKELLFFREELTIEEISKKKSSIEDHGITYEAMVHKVRAKKKEKLDTILKEKK